MNTLDAVHNDLDLPTEQRERKGFATLAAQFAFIGIELIRVDPEVIGQTPYYATSYGLWKRLESLDAARDYLTKRTKASRGQELQAQ